MSDHHHSHGPANRGRRVLDSAAPLFVEAPAGPVRGGLIVLHDAFGLTEPVERYCRAAAAAGWLAVAPYHYYDVGGREYDRDSARDALGRLSLRGLTDDVTAARDYLTERRRLDIGAVAVLGFSMGAFLAAWAGAEWELAAAVSVSPSRPDTGPLTGLPPLGELVRDRRTPWLGVLAEDDPQPSTTDVSAARSVDAARDTADHRNGAGSAGVPLARVEIVPGAAHGFFREPAAGAGRTDPPAWRVIRRFLAAGPGNRLDPGPAPDDLLAQRAPFHPREKR